MCHGDYVLGCRSAVQSGWPHAATACWRTVDGCRKFAASVAENRQLICIYALVDDGPQSRSRPGVMPATTAGMEEISREYIGHASSIQNWLRNVFVSFGVALFTTLLSSRTADHAARLTDGEVGPNLAHLSTTMGINDLNILSTLIVVLALPFVFAIRKARQKERGIDRA